MGGAQPRTIDVRQLGRERLIGCFLVGDVLIDCGPSSCAHTLIEALGDTAPRVLALTHIHLDHAGAAGTLVAHWPDLEVWVHERGAPHLVDPSKLLASATRLYGDDMQRLWGEVLPVPQDNLRVLRGGEDLDGLQVAYTPGHASHHISYWHPQSSTAFVGDVAGVRVAPSRYVLAPTPPPDIDLELWHESIGLVRAWHPARLAITHFDCFEDVAYHLDAIGNAQPSSSSQRSAPRSTATRRRATARPTRSAPRSTSVTWASSATGQSVRLPGEQPDRRASAERRA
jgi:glyoxylase-like metal-dependent hydrolase (beta-lactamase superfamily II)